jgi:hypothetical protein
MRGEESLPDRYRGSELLGQRDTVLFSELLDEAWVQLCITFDEPLFESAINEEELQRVSSWGVYSRLSEEMKGIGPAFVHGWSKHESHSSYLMGAFEEYKLGNIKHPKVWFGASLQAYPRISERVSEDFGTLVSSEMGAIANQLESDYNLPLNDFTQPLAGWLYAGDLIIYLANLKMMSLSRRRALLPITGKINHLQKPGVVRWSLENSTDEKLLAYFEKEIRQKLMDSEPHHFYANELARATSGKEEQMFGDYSSSMSDLWRAVWYMRNVTPRYQWGLMRELIERQEIPKVVEEVRSLAFAEPEKFPRFVVDQIRAGVWPSGALPPRYQPSISERVSETLSGILQWGQEEYDPRTEYLRTQAEALGDGLFLGELRASLLDHYKRNERFEAVRAASQATRVAEFLPRVFHSPWHEEVPVIKLDDGTEEYFLTSGNVSEILSWQELPYFKGPGIVEETLNILQKVLRRDYVEAGRFEAGQVRENLPDRYLCYLAEQAEVLGGGVFLKEIELRLREYFLSDLQRIKSSAHQVAGRAELMLKSVFSEHPNYLRSKPIYAGKHRETDEVMITPVGIREVLSWDRVPKTPKIPGISESNLVSLQMVLMEFVEERGIELPEIYESSD